MAFLALLLPWRSCLSLAWLSSFVVPTDILPDLVFQVLLQEQPYGMSVVNKCSWVFHTVPTSHLPCWWRSHPLSQLTQSSPDRATGYLAASRRQLFRRQDISAEFHFYSYTDHRARNEIPLGSLAGSVNQLPPQHLPLSFLSPILWPHWPSFCSHTCQGHSLEPHTHTLTWTVTSSLRPSLTPQPTLSLCPILILCIRTHKENPTYSCVLICPTPPPEWRFREQGPHRSGLSVAIP